MLYDDASIINFLLINDISICFILLCLYIGIWKKNIQLYLYQNCKTNLHKKLYL